MSEIHISFLAHSGFAVETATKVLVFDYYKDDKKIVDAYAKGSKPLWLLKLLFSAILSDFGVPLDFRGGLFTSLYYPLI